MATGTGVAVACEIRVDVGSVGSGGSVGAGALVDVGVGIRVREGIGVGKDVGEGFAWMVSLTRASMVASISGVGDGLTVGSSFKKKIGTLLPQAAMEIAIASAMTTRTRGFTNRLLMLVSNLLNITFGSYKVILTY